MVEIFENYWWLLFPLGFFVAAGWGSFMRYKRTQAKIDLLKTYAASGKEPPADLIASLDAPGDGRSDWTDPDHGARDDHSSYGTGSNAFLVILFAGFAAVFAYEGYSSLIGMGEVAYFVALIFVVLSAAFFVSSFFKGKK